MIGKEWDTSEMWVLPPCCPERLARELSSSLMKGEHMGHFMYTELGTGFLTC